jgi:60S ribosomal protein L4 C-terminal domain
MLRSSWVRRLLLVHLQTRQRTHLPLKKNPLKNLGALLKLNPYAKTARRQQQLLEVRRALRRVQLLCCKDSSGLQHLVSRVVCGLDVLYTGQLSLLSAYAHAHSQEKRQTAKAEKLDKIRKGEKAVDDKHRTAEQKQASKDFYKQVRSRVKRTASKTLHGRTERGTW